MKRLTALFFVVLRAGVSYAIFALFGAVCAFCALAFEFDNPHRKPAYSDALSNFLSDDSASEISLSEKELTEGFLGLLIDLEQKKNPRKTALSIPNPPTFHLSEWVLTAGVRASLAKSAGAEMKFDIAFDGSTPKLVGARLGEARIPLFAARKIADNMKSLYGVDEIGLEKIKEIKLENSTISIKK